MELVLNELSLRELAPDIHTARRWMEEFVQVYRHASKVGIKKKLRVVEDLRQYLLAPDYPVVKWMNDPEVSKELVSFFKSIAFSSPCIKIDQERDAYEAASRSEFWADYDRSIGLGAAYLMDVPSVSLNVDERWRREQIPLKMLWIEEEDDQLVENTEDIQVRHISCLSHVSHHEPWIQEQTQVVVYNGEDLWSQRDALFPHLDFCARVEEQIAHLGNNDQLFHQVYNRLRQLNDHFSKWTSGGFSTSEFPCKVNPESTETLRQYKADHTFLCHDGEERLFSWHVYLTAMPWRIFFYPDECRKIAFIGHIGRKLPNVSYRKV